MSPLLEEGPLEEMTDFELRAIVDDGGVPNVPEQQEQEDEEIRTSVASSSIDVLSRVLPERYVMTGYGDYVAATPEELIQLKRWRLELTAHDVMTDVFDQPDRDDRATYDAIYESFSKLAREVSKDPLGARYRASHPYEKLHKLALSDSAACTDLARLSGYVDWSEMEQLMHARMQSWAPALLPPGAWIGDDSDFRSDRSGDESSDRLGPHEFDDYTNYD